MPYDEDLADRIRALIGQEKGLTEQKMFGGLTFLVDGHIALSASGDGGLLVRIAPDDAVAEAKAEPMTMGARTMTGFMRVRSEDVSTKRALSWWTTRCVTYARSLPPKKRRVGKPRA